MHFTFSCVINWLQFDSNSSLTFSHVCLINKNDCFVLYTCPVETHFWPVNPDHVLAIWQSTSKVKLEPWIDHFLIGMFCYQENIHNKHPGVNIMRTFASCVTPYLKANLIFQLIQRSLLIVLCVSLILRFVCLGRVEMPQWFASVPEEDLSLMVAWYQWERVVQKTYGKKSNSVIKKMEKVCKKGTVEDALAVLKRSCQFFWSMFISRGHNKILESRMKFRERTGTRNK